VEMRGIEPLTSALRTLYTGKKHLIFLRIFS